MPAKRTAAKHGTQDPANAEDAGTRAFNDFCEALGREHFGRYAAEYRRTGDARFAWLAWDQLRNLRAMVPTEPTPEWLLRYIDTVAEKLCSLPKPNLGKGKIRKPNLGKELIRALGFKTGRSGGWAIRKAGDRLKRDAVLAWHMRELLAGEYATAPSAAPGNVRLKMAQPFVDARYRFLDRLKKLTDEERRRLLATLPEEHPLRKAKNLTALRDAIDRQVCEYKETLPSESTIRRAYERFFSKSPTS